MRKRLFSLFISGLFLTNLFGVVEVKPVLAEATATAQVSNENNNAVATTAVSGTTNEQWYFNNLQVTELWKLSTGSGVTVAVIGSGIDISHEDLAGKVIGGKDFTEDNNPYLDRVGDGTYAAGIIAADKENNIGICGIAYDSKLLSVKVTNNIVSTDATNIASGIKWAADNGAKILDISFIILSDDSIVKEAVDYAVSKGCIIINPMMVRIEKKDYPSITNNVISIGATNELNQWCNFSDYTEAVDLVAPGENIYSTTSGDNNQEKYKVDSNIVASAAIAAAQIALISSKQPQLTTNDILNIIKDGTFKLSSECPDLFYGYGILDVKKVLTGSAGQLKTTGAESLDDNSINKAHSITSSKSISDNTYGPNDSDWYKVYVPANTTVKLTATNTAANPNNSMSGFLIYIFSNDIHFKDSFLGVLECSDYYMFNQPKDRYVYFEVKNIFKDKSTYKLDFKYLSSSEASNIKDVTFKCAIDSPRQGQSVTGNILDISGWALSKQEIRKYQAKIDNQIIDLNGEQPRQDVYNVYKEYLNPFCGFTKQLDISNLSYGSHQLTFMATADSGIISYSNTISFNIPSTTKTCIDTVSQGMKVSGTSLPVNGWALSKDTISKVEAIIDNDAPVQLKYGQPRTDVYNVFKDYNNKNSGFSGIVDIKKYAAGSHTVKLKITHVNGRVELLDPVTFNISNTLISSLDTVKPGNIIKNGSLAVGGWVISKEGITSVEAIIDNNEPVKINYGGSRPDVYNAFKDYNNNKSGFNGNIDISKLSLGGHRIKIRVTEANGRVSVVSEVPFVIENLNEFVYSIDTPSHGRNVSGNVLNIGGWALSKTGVEKIEAIIDGVSYGELKYGLVRPDVYNAFKDYNNQKSGFNGAVDISKLSYGKHDVQISVTDKAGKINTSKAISINIVESRITTLDYPRKGSNIIGNTLDVSGWALSMTGITKVEALVDGVAQNIQYGLSRPDVYNAFKNYDNKSSGFFSKVDISGLSFGSHSIAMRYTDARGQVTVSEVVNFNIENTLKYCIDTVQNNMKITDNYIKVSGWALSKVGIEKVEALIDGMAVTVGYGNKRLDVYNVFKEYNNEASGFYTILDTIGLASGQHTFVMKFTDNNGKVAYSNELKINIVRGNLIDNTSMKEISDADNQITIGRAFRITNEYAQTKKDIVVKYSYDPSMNIKEENLGVFMMDEEGKLNKSWYPFTVDKVNNTVSFHIDGLGVYVIDDKERVASITR